MLYDSYKMFTMVISFIKSSWDHMHVIVGIFEMQNIVGAVMEN